MKKKLLSCLLAATLSVSLLAGCGNGDNGTDAGSTPAPSQDASGESSNEGGDAAADAGQETSASGYQTTYGSKTFDNVTIQVELFDRENAPEGATITDNKWTKYVQEEMAKVGINVEFVPVPRGDEIDKMTSMMAGGIAPDIVLTYTYARAQEYYEQGGVWDLAPFVDGEGQAENLKEYLGENVIDMARINGNELYGIIARRATNARSDMYVRKDWMDALGISTPTTVEEFYDMVDQMVHNNPEGRTDAIGLTWVWDNGCLMAAFSKLASDPLQSQISCNLTRDYVDEGMKEFWRYRNKMYNNGLLHTEYYTLKHDDRINYIVSGRTATTEDHVNSNLDGRLQTLKATYPDADLAAIPPLKNIWDGQQYNATYSEGGLIAFVPKTADEETVEACVTYLDWLCTEAGGFVLCNGFEGEHYEYDENGALKVLDTEYNATDKNWISNDLFLTGNGGYFRTLDDLINSQVQNYPEYKQHVIDNYTFALQGGEITDIDDSLYTSPAQAELAADITLVKDEWLVKLVTCPEADFDANWDQYMAALKDAGVETVHEERTAHFTNQ